MLATHVTIIGMNLWVLLWLPLLCASLTGQQKCFHNASLQKSPDCFFAWTDKRYCCMTRVGASLLLTTHNWLNISMIAPALCQPHMGANCSRKLQRRELAAGWLSEIRLLQPSTVLTRHVLTQLSAGLQDWIPTLTDFRRLLWDGIWWICVMLPIVSNFSGDFLSTQRTTTNRNLPTLYATKSVFKMRVCKNPLITHTSFYCLNR